MPVPADFSDIVLRDAVLDGGRSGRCGMPEVIFGGHKTAEQIIRISAALHAAGQPILVTRVTQEKAAAVVAALPELGYDLDAGTLGWLPTAPVLRGRVAIVAAGTSDAPVVHEAAATLRFLGAETDCIFDVGVAGLHRLLARLDRIKTADIVIAVAGMEGALPGVLAGLIALPIIAVPTSVGYGVSAGGRTALDGMLASCAAGLVVVNIDNGFGAACAAWRMLNSRGLRDSAEH